MYFFLIFGYYRKEIEIKSIANQWFRIYKEYINWLNKHTLNAHQNLSMWMLCSSVIFKPFVNSAIEFHSTNILPGNQDQRHVLIIASLLTISQPTDGSITWMKHKFTVII